MTATSGKQYAVGLRKAQIFALDANGYPSATGTTAYEGLEIAGAKAFDITTPDARRIFHTGNDRLLAQDFLPTLEGASATIRASRNDYATFAVLTGTKELTLGEAKVIGYATDLQGAEPDIGIIAYQQSKDATAKTRTWRSYIIPVSNAVIKPASMNDNAAEYEYQILPQVATQHLWGVDFASGTDGFTEAQLIEVHTENQPWVCAWKSNGSATKYLFSTTHQAKSTAKIHVVAKAGVAITAGGMTKYATGITLAATTPSGDIIVAFYELA